MVLPLLSAALPILGGLFGAGSARRAEAKAIKEQNAYNAPDQVRKRAEDAGFNPLLFVGPGVGQQTTTGGTMSMGSAIADSAMMLADAFSKTSAKSTLEKVNLENSSLKKQVTNLTLRPKVGGGMYMGRRTPSLASALGVKSAPISSDMPSGVSDGLMYGGANLAFNPAFSSAQKLEDRYGEIGGAVLGLGVLGGDVIHSAERSPSLQNIYSKVTGGQTPVGPSDLEIYHRNRDAAHLAPASGKYGRVIGGFPKISIPRSRHYEFDPGGDYDRGRR